MTNFAPKVSVTVSTDVVLSWLIKNTTLNQPEEHHFLGLVDAMEIL